MLRAVARSSAAAALSTRLATSNAARPAAATLLSRRALSDGVHDDFKPKVKRDAGGDEAAVHAQIKEDIEEYPVVVYMKGIPTAPMCGFSNAVVQVMKAEGVDSSGPPWLPEPAAAPAQCVVAGTVVGPSPPLRTTNRPAPLSSSHSTHCAARPSSTSGCRK